MLERAADVLEARLRVDEVFRRIHRCDAAFGREEAGARRDSLVTSKLALPQTLYEQEMELSLISNKQ